jgi:hypothetical protein
MNLNVSPDLIRAIDDWRRTQPAIPTRAEAARLLIARGIEADKAAPPAGSAPSGPPKRVPNVRR